MKHFPTRKDLIASFAKDTVGVEVGVQAGIFSQEILDCGVKHLHLVDPWEHQTGEYAKDVSNIDQGGQDALFRLVKHKFDGDPRVTIHRKYSLEGAYNFGPVLDFFFLDACHTEDAVMGDLISWKECLKPGGIILGHDYTNSPEAQAQGFGVVQAVDQFCQDFGWEMTAITDEIWPSYMLEKK